MAALRVCGKLRTGRRRSAFLVQHLNLKRVSRMGRRRCCAHLRALCRSCGFLGPFSCRSRKPLTSKFHLTGTHSASSVCCFMATFSWIAAGARSKVCQPQQKTKSLPTPRGCVGLGILNFVTLSCCLCYPLCCGTRSLRRW